MYFDSVVVYIQLYLDFTLVYKCNDWIKLHKIFEDETEVMSRLTNLAVVNFMSLLVTVGIIQHIT